MRRFGRASCGLVLVLVAALASPSTAAAASTSTDLQNWGNEALKLLGGVGLAALAVLGFGVAALLAAVLLLRVPPITVAARWLSKREWGTADFYSPRISGLWKR